MRPLQWQKIIFRSQINTINITCLKRLLLKEKIDRKQRWLLNFVWLDRRQYRLVQTLLKLLRDLRKNFNSFLSCEIYIKIKINLNIYFYTSLRFIKTFWDTTKKYENKILSWCLFQYNFPKRWRRKGLRNQFWL